MLLLLLLLLQYWYWIDQSAQENTSLCIIRIGITHIILLHISIVVVPVNTKIHHFAFWMTQGKVSTRLDYWIVTADIVRNVSTYQYHKDIHLGTKV